MQTVTTDPLLNHARRGASAVVRLLKSVPPAQRIAELDRVLAQQDPALPQRVRATANRLAKRGMTADAAVQEALARSLADHTITYYKSLGRRGERGALGQTPTAPQTTQGQSAGQVVQGVIGGVACSSTLQNAIADHVGKNEGTTGHDAVTTGFAIASGVAGGCQPTTPTATTPTPPPPPPPSRMSAVVPLLIGAGIVLAVGVVVVKTGRAHAARHAAQGT